MDLTEEQQQTVAGWVAEGMSLAQVQSNLTEQFNLTMTYQDVRFLLDDLDLTPQNTPEQKTPTPTEDTDEDSSADSTPAESTAEKQDMQAPAAQGGLTVEVDQVVRPGNVVSGNVTFSDGMKASWYIDQMGRMGLNPARESYQPSASDIQQFQQQLQTHLQKQGL